MTRSFTVFCWSATCTACPAITVQRWEDNPAPRCCAACGSLIATLTTGNVTVHPNPPAAA